MTKVTLTGWVGGLVLALTAILPTRAADEKTHPCVVLVGINKYADEQILPCPHAEADVQALYDLFTSKENVGLPPENVRLLLGKPNSKRPSELATHANILKAVRWAAANAGRDDLVVLAFVIQGAPLNERACYFGTDSTLKDRNKNAVSSSEIEDALANLKSRRFCAFLDVNFKGYKSDKDAPPDLDGSNFYHEFMSTGKEDAPVPPGRVLFLANRGNKPSLQLGKHGLFAHVLLDGLKGAADIEGYEPDGVVTVDELGEYMKKEYGNQVRKLTKTDEDREQQQLFILGSRSSRFELTRNPAVVAQVKERLDKFTRMSLDKLDKDLAKKIAEEGKDLLSRMPKLEAKRNLRKKYQQLADGELKLEDFVTDRAKILEGMKLDRDVAKKFAAKVINATHHILGEYVKEVNQGDLVASAIRGLYLRIDEKIPQELRERLEKVKDMKESDLTNFLADVRQGLGKREDLENHKDIDFALQRMMSPLDPYTTYIDPETLSSFKREMGGNFTGIGIQIRGDSAREQLMVISPIKDSPAYKAGIKAGDIITHIKLEVDAEGKALETPEIIPTKGLHINDAVKRIVGKAGTEVKLVIDRAGADKPLEFKIRRGNVEVETVLGFKRKTDDSWDYLIDPENQICYVRLTQFSRYTERDLAQVLNRLKKTPGIKGLVLDLRFNPGGLLTSAVNISDMFIDDGLIVTIRPRVGREQPHMGDHEGSLTNFPMACLVNGHSASGSEIVSACLQDHNRAIVVGERSYGKGSVQNIQPFEEGELKLTTASFWRPNGKNLNRSSTKGRDQDEWGVSPDKAYLVKLTGKERDSLEAYLKKQEIIPRRDIPSKDEGKPDFKDKQLETALKYLRGQLNLAAKAQTKKAG
jgi:C-terminal peptidase prc